MIAPRITKFTEQIYVGTAALGCPPSSSSARSWSASRTPSPPTWPARAPCYPPRAIVTATPLTQY